MTAASIIVRDKAAYLLTDTAIYEAGGTIIGFKAKVVASERLRIAIAVSGLATTDNEQTVRSYLKKHRATETAVAGLSGLLDALQADVEAIRQPGDHTDGMSPWVRVHAIAYSRVRDAAGGFICASHDRAFPGGYQAGTVRGVSEAISPEIGKCAPLEFARHPKRHAVAIFAHQRQHSIDGVSFVGGAGQLTAVSSHGVTTETVVKWSDQVGRKVLSRG